MTPTVLNLQHRAWIAVSALTVLLMLPNLIWLCVGQGATIWISGLLVPTLLLAFLFALFGNRIWLACVMLIPFAMLAPIEASYIATYLHPTDAEILATVIATNPREIDEYLGSALIPIAISSLAGLLLALIAARWSWQIDMRWRHRSQAWIIATMITLPLAAGAASFAITDGNMPERWQAGMGIISQLSDTIEPSYPFGLFQRIAEYHQEWKQMRIDASRLDTFRFHARRLSITKQRQVYVLVIGESSRRDHWQLFGYSRATNPELSKVQNLIQVPDMLTSWSASLTAIPQLLTRKPITGSNLLWKEASVLRAMSEAGLETYWISNQLAIGQFDSPVSTYAYEAKHVSFLNHASWTAPGSYDGVLLQPLRDALKDSQKDLFIVLHMMGSHGGYDFRYPVKFQHFRPVYSNTNSSEPRNERIRNSYDNTILYTDHVLAGVINILQESGAVTALLYESDHGEDLPTTTCSLMGHGNGTPYDFQVPAFFWYSNAYAKIFPQRIATFRSNAGKRVLSADTFETLVDMVGVTFPSHDPSWSLFSDRWHYRTRTVNGFWQTDMDHAIYGKQCKLAMPANN